MMKMMMRLARAWQKTLERERSGERRLQKWFERGAAVLPLTLRSHALE